MKTIRWGIVGPGNIAHKFARTVQNVEGATLAAVCGISMEESRPFAEKYGIPQAFCDNNEMAAFDGIDAVYISTPHSFHAPCAELYIKAGKHILCEKPLCVTAKEAERLQKLAEEHQVFIMEAMWMRFLPAVQAAAKAAKEGAIGQIKSLRAAVCGIVSPQNAPRMYRNELAGGSLMDTGVYALHFAHLILGEPLEIRALSKVEGGVDHHTEILLRYQSGATASLCCGMDFRSPKDGYIFGDSGQIRLPVFYGATSWCLTLGRDPEQTFDCPCLGDGFEEEVQEACDCIRAGKLQSEIHPISGTVAVMKQMDEIRRQIGLTFPADKE